MTEQDKPQFKKVMFLLSEYFPREISKLTLQAYYSALSDLTIDQVTDAASKYSKSGKFFPKPSELRELAFDDNQLLAGDAWSEVKRLINRHVPYDMQNVKYSSPLIERAVRSVGGLMGIWKAGSDQESYIRHAFIRDYEAMQSRSEKLQLIGAPTQSEAKQIISKISLNLAEKFHEK